MGKINKFSRFVGWLAVVYTNINLYFNTVNSIWVKVLVAITWPLRILFNLPSQIVIMANYFYGFYLFRIRNDLEIIGQENIPAGINILFLPNHQAWTDPWGVGTSISNPKKIVFCPSWVPWTVADEKNYANPWFGPILWLAKIITVKRDSGEADVEASLSLKKWKKFLRIGNLVLYFEGGRSRTKEIKPCISNVARLIYDNFNSNGQGNYIKQVVPIRIIGFDEIQPAEVDRSKIKKARLNPFKVGKNKKCQVIIGQPIKFDQDLFSKDFESVEGVLRKIVRDSVNNLAV
jgi:1-acyl-sn-glycerol-3-phosphate acyltransferase